MVSRNHRIGCVRRHVQLEWKLNKGVDFESHFLANVFESLEMEAEHARQLIERELFCRLALCVAIMAVIDISSKTFWSGVAVETFEK